ncbi:putative secreted protein, partial [Rhodopirellula sallentina SM41]
MRITSLAIVFTLSFIVADTLQAQPGGGRRQGPGSQGPGGQGGAFATRFFSQNDKNNDGTLTGDEIPERMRQNLQRLDANNDGAIQKSELEKMFSGRGEGMGGRMGGRMAGGMGGRMGGREQRKDTTVAEAGEKAIEVEIVSPDKVYDAYLYWHHADELFLDSVNYAILADAEGKVVHRWDTNLTGGGHTSYLLETGGILRIGKRDGSGIGPVASADTMQITDRTGKAIWQLNAEDLDIEGNRILFHHDMKMRPNGNIFALIYEELSAEEAAAAGWTPENVRTFWSDGVMEIKPNLEDGAHEVVWQWRFIDHIVQDKDPEAPNYGVVAEHPRRIDAHYPSNYDPS